MDVLLQSENIIKYNIYKVSKLEKPIFEWFVIISCKAYNLLKIPAFCSISKLLSTQIENLTGLVEYIKA